MQEPAPWRRPPPPAHRRPTQTRTEPEVREQSVRDESARAPDPAVTADATPAEAATAVAEPAPVAPPAAPPRAEPRVEQPRPEQRPEQRPESRPEPRGEPRGEARPDGREPRQPRPDREPRPEPAAPSPAPAPAAATPDSTVASMDAETNAKYELVKGGKLYIKDLQVMDIHGLHDIARAEGIQDFIGQKKQDLIFQILRSRIRQNGLMYGEGVLEILPDGFGFLRSPEYNYLPMPRRHLHQPQPDPPVRLAQRPRRAGPDPPAQGERAILRAAPR